MKKYIELCRVKHWIKNLLIFIPMICSNTINLTNVINTILCFFSFSFLTSFVYIINDVKDIEKDKLHKTKKNRPLPSGKIKKKTAIIIAILMIIVSLFINTFINKSLINIPLAFLVVYMILNLLYSFGLKNIAIIDVAILASGFIFRVYYGASIINVDVSNWLFLTILSASLFLGLGKRRKELESNKEVRKVLEEYNAEFLNRFQYLCLTIMIVFYSLWTFEQNNQLLVYTIPLIMLIFMKYCLVIEKSDEGDPTTILYQDKILLGICATYSIIMLISLL